MDGTVVDITNILGESIGLLEVLIMAATTALIVLGSKALGLKKDSEVTLMIEKLAHQGISLAANRLREESKNLADPEVKNELLALAVNYINSMAPELVKKYKLDEKLYEMVEAILVERLDIETTHMVEDITAGGKTSA